MPRSLVKAADGGEAAPGWSDLEANGVSLRCPQNTVRQPAPPTALTFLPNPDEDSLCKCRQSWLICACCASQVKVLRDVPNRRSARSRAKNR